MNYRKTDVDAVEQNLRDAGCSDEFVVTFMQVWGTGTLQEQLQLLSRQRCVLLDSVHTAQKSWTVWTICATSCKNRRRSVTLSLGKDRLNIKKKRTSFALCLWQISFCVKLVTAV